METKILVTGSTFFFASEGRLVQQFTFTHHHIFFLQQGEIFWWWVGIKERGGRADAGLVPTVGLCSVKRMFRCSTSDDLTNDTSYMAALSEADALITFLVGHSLHRLMMIFIIIGSGDK